MCWGHDEQLVVNSKSELLKQKTEDARDVDAVAVAPLRTVTVAESHCRWVGIKRKLGALEY